MSAFGTKRTWSWRGEWYTRTRECGGRAQDRTGDPCDVNAVLIPLSYAPGSGQEREPLYRFGCPEGNPRRPKDQAASIRST
jgi:hypothetical protein